MALLLFWRCESTNLANSLDYTRGTDYDVFMANSSSISASAARVGNNGLLGPSGAAGGAQISQAGWEGNFPGDVSNPSTSVGCAGFSFNFPTSVITNDANFGFRVTGSVSTNNQIVGRFNTSSQLGFGIGNATNGLYQINTTVVPSTGTWYGAVFRWNFPAGRIRVELYNSSGDLLSAAENATSISSNIPAELGQMMSWGSKPGVLLADIYFDNCFVGDTFDEPIQKFFTISDYSEYINNIGFTSRGLSLTKKYVTRGYLEDSLGSLLGNSNMLFGTGSGAGGRLGTNSTTNRSSPVSVVGGVGWIDVATGDGIAFGLKSDNTMWAFGENILGELGDGTTTTRSSPVTVVGSLSWRAVAAGENNGYGITTDGQLWSWGGGANGALGNNSTANRSSPGTVAGGGTTWKQVSSTATGQVVGAIKNDGTLWMWGLNSTGQLGDGTTVNKSSPVTVAGGGNTWKQVSTASAAAGAVKTDGSLWTWGQGTDGQTGRNTTANVSSPTTIAGGGYDWKFVAFNYRNNGAIKVDGSLWMWGKNESGGLGDGTTVNKSSPVSVAGGGYSWRWLSVGSFLTTADVASAVKSDGTLWSWGLNSSGQLGDGTTVNKSSPISVITTDWIRWSRCSISNINLYAITETDAIALFKR